MGSIYWTGAHIFYRNFVIVKVPSTLLTYFTNIIGVSMCNDCYDPVIEAIQKCSYDDECLQAETGFCYSCMCNVVAAMKLEFLNPLCAPNVDKEA